MIFILFRLYKNRQERDAPGTYDGDDETGDPDGGDDGDPYSTDDDDNSYPGRSSGDYDDCPCMKYQSPHQGHGYGGGKRYDDYERDRPPYKGSYKKDYSYEDKGGKRYNEYRPQRPSYNKNNYDNNNRYSYGRKDGGYGGKRNDRYNKSYRPSHYKNNNYDDYYKPDLGSDWWYDVGNKGHSRLSHYPAYKFQQKIRNKSDRYAGPLVYKKEKRNDYNYYNRRYFH